MGKSEQFGQKFIYFILALFFGSEVLLSSTIEKIFIWEKDSLNDAMAIITLGLLLMQIVFFQVYQIEELALIAVVSVPIIIATINSEHNTMISTWIFIIAAKYIDFDKAARLSYYVELLMTLVVFYIFATGVISEYTIYRGSILRHSLGFIHPNQLGVRIFLLVVCRCYIRKDRFNYIDWGIVVGAAVFINKVANSKTSFYALIILAVIMLVHIIMQKTGVGLESASKMLIIAAVAVNVLSLFLSFIQVKNYSLLSKFDAAMSHRFSQCHRTMAYYGVKLFGQDIQLIVNRPAIGRVYRFFLDNAYMSMVLRYGPIVFILFSGLYIWAMIMLRQMGQYALVEILCLYAIYGTMENNFFSMSQNLFLLVLSYPIYKHIEQDGKKKSLLPQIKVTW